MQLFQIFYNEATRASLDPDFTPLDNSDSERPDLFEYWPIRHALKTRSFRDDERLGFFSPRFMEKTAMTGRQVRERLAQCNGEIVSFSPAFEQIACHPNSFVQGEMAHPGFLALAQDTVRALGINIDLSQLIQDQTRTIYSNYFVATYRFWRDWLTLTERVLAIAEDTSSPLGIRLNARTHHRGLVSYPMKIFLLERMVSLLLELNSTDAEIGIDFGRAPLTWQGAERLINILLALDAMKGQFLKTHSPVYIQAYAAQRRQFFQPQEDALRAR